MVLHLDAARKRLVREHNSRMTAAYYGGLIPHIKNAPKLKDLLIEEAGPKPMRQTVEQQIAVARQWTAATKR
jgi:hypothetical protein